MAVSPIMLLLLVSAGVLLSSTEAQETYNNLPDSYKKGVDLALKQLHSHNAVQNHFLFLKSLHRSEIESGFKVKYLYHNFYLKPTTCSKGTTDPQRCQFRHDRPLMDCVVCYKTVGDEIETYPKPYVTCLHKPVITQDVKTRRVSHCEKMSYSSGAPTLLASRT